MENTVGAEGSQVVQGALREVEEHCWPLWEVGRWKALWKVRGICSRLETWEGGGGPVVENYG